MKLLSLLLLAFSALSANIELPENFQADFSQKITNTKEKVINSRAIIDLTVSGLILTFNLNFFFLPLFAILFELLSF